MGTTKMFKTDSKDRGVPFQRAYDNYTPLNTSITQVLVAIKGKVLLVWPKRAKEGPTRLQSNKYRRFHNDYGHHTDELTLKE